MPNYPTDVASICSNPNVMVALVNSARLIWVPVDRYDMRRFGESWDPLALLSANAHIRDLMDAVAELSSNEGNPSIACALRVDNDRKLEIIIASSNDVKPETQEYIRMVWEEMVAISALSRSLRGGVNDARIGDKSRALVHAIYTFCMPTFSKTFLKNLSRLREWVATYKEWHREKASKPEPSWPLRMDELRPLVVIIENMLKNLSVYENAVTMSFIKSEENTLDEFISTMDDVMEQGKKLLGINPVYNPFTNDWRPLVTLGVIGNPYYIGGLRHCLEDLISFPQNIEKLRKFYLSRHFAEISSYELRIKLLNKGIYRAPLGLWPSSPLVWKQVYEYLYRKKRYIFLGNEDAHDFSRIPANQNELVVHPTLKIAIYLNTVSHTLAEKGGHYTPPFNYISVSGLPCRPCALWLSKLNSIDRGHGVEFGGTSYKWPNDWGMPTMKANKISRHMRDWAWYDYEEGQSMQEQTNLVSEAIFRKLGPESFQ